MRLLFRFVKNLDLVNLERGTKEPLAERPGSNTTELPHGRVSAEIFRMEGSVRLGVERSFEKYLAAADFARTLNFLRLGDDFRSSVGTFEKIAERFLPLVALRSPLSILEFICLGVVE